MRALGQGRSHRRYTRALETTEQIPSLGTTVNGTVDSGVGTCREYVLQYRESYPKGPRVLQEEMETTTKMAMDSRKKRTCVHPDRHELGPLLIKQRTRR